MTDSPWFWVLIFATVGLLGVAFIGPKHAKRQERLDEKNVARDEVRLRAMGGTVAAHELALSEEDEDPRAGLWPLMGLLIAVMLVASAALVLNDPRVKGTKTEVAGQAEQDSTG